jgi:hypothetical protein
MVFLGSYTTAAHMSTAVYMMEAFRYIAQPHVLYSAQLKISVIVER